MGTTEEIALRNEIQRLRDLLAGFEGPSAPNGAQSSNRHSACQPWQASLEALARNCVDGMSIVGADLRYRFVNDTFARMLDLCPDAMIGRTNRELGVPDAVTAVWEEHLCRVFESGLRLESENELATPDGVRLLSTRFSPECDPAGAVVSVFTLYRDITERKRADELIRSSEERLRFAQQAAGIGSFDWNLRTGVDTWTTELEAMHGLPPGGFPRTQRAWEDLLHPEDRDRMVALVERSFGNQTPVEAEWRIVRPDGNIRWIAGRWRVLTDDAGNPARVMGVNLDITDRKRMNEALRQSEERFRLAVKATNDAIWDADLVSGTLSCNTTYSTLYGAPGASNSWKRRLDAIHPEDRERIADGLDAAIFAGASSWSSEYRMRRADGGWAYVYDRAYIARDASGNAWRLVGAMQDLTERKAAETALRENDLQHKEVFDNISVCLFLVDVTPGGRFRYAAFNPAEEEAVGLTNEQIAGKFVEEVFDRDLARKLSDNYRRCVAAGRAIKYDDELNLPGGRRYFHSNLIPLRNAAGEINRIIGACIDITDLRRT
jgi:PAS domain S-box-containing protein